MTDLNPWQGNLFSFVVLNRDLTGPLVCVVDRIVKLCFTMVNVERGE